MDCVGFLPRELTQSRVTLLKNHLVNETQTLHVKERL